jgi:prepilin-type N-terminal cleavage/methylation domain-containing protein
MARGSSSAKQTRRGFTLIEILVTIGILAATFVGYAATVNGSAASSHAKSQEIALRIATSELESLRGGGYAALPQGGSFSSPDLALLTDGSGTVMITGFDAGTKRANVTVAWNEAAGGRSISLDTLITEGGLR